MESPWVSNLMLKWNLLRRGHVDSAFVSTFMACDQTPLVKHSIWVNALILSTSDLQLYVAHAGADGVHRPAEIQACVGLHQAGHH